MTIEPIGTRIRFTKTLDVTANEYSPAHVFATEGEFGEITGHGTKEGYWVKRDYSTQHENSWDAPFWASCDEFEPVESDGAKGNDHLR